jgi:hypothetical protein
MKIDYSGLYRAQNRDNKIRKRKKLEMTRDGDSVKLLDKLHRERIKKAQDELQDI